MFATLTTSRAASTGLSKSVGLSQLRRSSIAAEIARLTEEISQEVQPDLLASLASKAILKYLTDETRTAIHRFTASNSPFLLIKGAIDTTGLPPTPNDDTSPNESAWRLQAATMLGFLKLCDANARSFKDEMGGRLFHMVMPAQNDLKSKLRSTKALNFHTEVVNGFFREENPEIGAPIAPEKFALACLRNPHSVPTTVLPLAEVLARLSTDSKRVLQQPSFVAKSQSSFDRDIVIHEVPALVRLNSGALALRYSSSKLAANCPASAAALSELQMVIGSFDSSWSIALEPGDILILNNQQCLHGRGEVASSSQFDGADRWLLRLYGYHDVTLPLLSSDSRRPHVMLVDKSDYPIQISA